MNSIWWEYIIFLIVVFNAVSLILDLISRPTFELVAEIILVVVSTTALSFLITVIVIHVSRSLLPYLIIIKNVIIYFKTDSGYGMPQLLKKHLEFNRYNGRIVFVILFILRVQIFLVRSG